MKQWRMIPWILAIIMVGCVPTRYSWSPDGKWMTVIGPKGLQFCDADGNLQPGTIAGVKIATWFPDSKRLLVDREINATTWGELTKYLTPDQTESITDTAGRAREALMSYDWTAPGANDWQKFTDSQTAKDKETAQDLLMMKKYGLAIGLYVRDHADNALQQKVPAERWKELQSLLQPVQCLEVYTVDPLSSIPTVQLGNVLQGIHDLRVSPTGVACAVTTDGDSEHGSRLWIIGTAAHDTDDLILSEDAAWCPDWSPDGRDVLFIRAAQPASGDAARFGSLSRVRVVGDDGALLTKHDAPQDLAGLVYDELSRVRCLKDGRILFASVDVTLPATANDLPQRPQLFSLTPGSTPTVARLLPRQAYEQVGDGAQCFEVSPDSRHVSIPNKNGTIDIVDLQSGDVTTAQDNPIPSTDSNHQPSLFSIPQWRSNDELTVVAPGDNGHPSVVLWSIAKKAGTTLSKTWPAGTTDEQSTTQPTTQP